MTAYQSTLGDIACLIVACCADLRRHRCSRGDAMTRVIKHVKAFERLYEACKTANEAVEGIRDDY